MGVNVGNINNGVFYKLLNICGTILTILSWLSDLTNILKNQCYVKYNVVKGEMACANVNCVKTHELVVKVKCEVKWWMIWNNTTFPSMQTLFSFQCMLGSGWIETGIFFVMFTTLMFKTSLLCLLWPLKQVFQNNSPAYIMSWCLYLQPMRGPNLESGDNVNLRCLWKLLHHPQRRPS